MKPLIGISTNFLTVDKGKFLGMERVYVNKDYVDVVTEVGGIPLLLPPVEDIGIIRQYVQLCGGFILSGGGDINPILYGEAPHPLLEEIHTALDRAQWLLTEEILKTEKTLLAICRGMQLLNVVSGGTLWQDRSEIEQPTLLHSQNGPRWDVFHTVSVVKDSMLERIYGKEIKVNSFHHQCLKKIGHHLKVTATASDGVVEAVELTDRPFGLGVQWHPEMLQHSTGERSSLFRDFIHYARQ